MSPDEIAPVLDGILRGAGGRTLAGEILNRKKGKTVNSARERFAHVILFQCPQCQGPLASAYSSCNKEMESLDGGQFGSVCRCGWIGDGLDFMAVNRSVQPWEAVCEAVCEAPAPVERGSFSDYILNPRDWLFRVAKEIASFAPKR